MQYGITLELARKANLAARSCHSGLYCSVHECVADLPAEEPQHPGGPYYTRSVRVHFAGAAARRALVLTADSDGDDEALLTALYDKLIAWQVSLAAPEDSLWVTDDEALALLALATHHLTTPAERAELLLRFCQWQTVKDARELAAGLTAKIEARSPGIITGRGWMPHGEPTPKPSPAPFPAAD